MKVSRFLSFACLLSSVLTLSAPAEAKTWSDCRYAFGKACPWPSVKVGNKCCQQSKETKNIGFKCVQHCQGNRNFNSCVYSCRLRNGAPAFGVR